MRNNYVSKIVSHRFNGNEEEVKIVEIDGKKFIADETDVTKAKLDDKQQPIPFVDKKVDVKIEDYTKAELDELAKINPHVAKMLDDKRKRDEDDQKRLDDEKKKADEDAEKKGEWQKIAETRGAELATSKDMVKQKEEMLGKYVEMTNSILKGLLTTIPKENLTLIPEKFSPREKVEYIFANAARLGAKVNAIDGKVDKNDGAPVGTDEDVLATRITELTKKAQDRTATNAELSELREKGSKLTQIRREKEKNK